MWFFIIKSGKVYYFTFLWIAFYLIKKQTSVDFENGGVVYKKIGNLVESK